MGLSCDNDYCPEPGDTSWWIPRKMTRHSRKRLPKCCSCGDKVPAEKDCLEFVRYKVPEYDIEISIYGEDGEVPRASHFMCFECGWRYLGLARHEYAINIYDDMRRLMIEHDDLTAAGHAGCL